MKKDRTAEKDIKKTAPEAVNAAENAGSGAKDGGKEKKKGGIREVLSGKRFAKNTNMAVLVIVAVAVFVLVNILFRLLPDIDLTTGKLFTLTDVTRREMNALEKDVTIYALYDRVEGESETGPGKRAELVKVLDLYDQFPRITVKYVDLDRNPSFLKNTVGESASGNYAKNDYIVKCGNNLRHLTSSDLYVTEKQTYNYFYEYEITYGLQAETKFTSAVLKVTGDTPVIYYSTGFGENQMNRYSKLIDYIDDGGYDVETIDLRISDIPENAASIIFCGPAEDLTDAAADKLDRWLKKGHAAFFFMDVKSLTGDAVIYEKFTNFNAIFANYGISLERTIVEESGENAMQGTGEDRIFKANTSQQGSLETLKRSEVYVANSRSLDLDNTKSTSEAEAIISTTKNAKSVSIDNDNNTRSGISVVAASGKCHQGSATSQIVVFGSSWTFSDMLLTYYGASVPQQIVASSMKWMKLESKSNVGDSIEARKYNNGVRSAVVVTDNQMTALVIVTMIAIPLVILAIGLIIWLRRRHL